MSRWLAVMVAAGLSMAASAADIPLQLSGSWQQGGLIVGKTAPGTQVSFNGEALRVSENGDFVFGLHYEAPPAAELRLDSADGQVLRKEFAVQARQYDEQRISGLPGAMVNPPQNVLDRIGRDAALVKKARAVESDFAHFSGGFRWPISARITGVFGSRRVLNGTPKRPHFGIDMAAPKGTPIKAPADASVSMAEKDLYYTGGTVILDHGHGVSTTYLHLSQLDVAVGDKVSKGEVIGRVGATGRATGPHLCWRANWFDVRLDPSLLVESRPIEKGEKR